MFPGHRSRDARRIIETNRSKTFSYNSYSRSIRFIERSNLSHASTAKRVTMNSRAHSHICVRVHVCSCLYCMYEMRYEITKYNRRAFVQFQIHLADNDTCYARTTLAKSNLRNISFTRIPSNERHIFLLFTDDQHANNRTAYD